MSEAGRPWSMLIERVVDHGALAIFGAVAALYGLLALSAYELFGALTIGVTFFPPAGLTFAAFVLVPRFQWPAVVGAIVLAEVVVDMAEGQTFWWSMAWAAANTVEPIVGAVVFFWLLGRGASDRRIAMDGSFAWAFLAGGLLVGPAAGAAIGATNLTVADGVRWIEGGFDTWVGDSLGVLVVAPVVFAFGAAVSLPLISVRRREVAFIGLSVGVLALLLFTTDHAPIGYAAIPLLAWVALQYGSRGLAIVAAAVASLATAATAHDRGPWATDSGTDAQTQLGRQQSFLWFAIGGAWILALEVRRRVQAVEQARDARADLDQALERAELVDQVGRERDRIASLQALTATLTAAANQAEIIEAVRSQSDTIVNGAELRLVGAHEPSVPTDAEPPPSRPAPVDRAATSSTELELRSHGTFLGKLQVDFDDDVASDPSAQARVATVVALVTEALERARLHEAERTQRLLLGAINQVLAALAAASTVADVATTVERFGLAALGADSLTLAVRRDDGRADDIEVLVAVGDTAAAVGERMALTTESPIAASARTGVASFADHDPDGPHPVMARAALPLRLGSRTLGVITCTRAEPWSDPLRVRALSFASFVADALARVIRAELDHEVALTLQEALMPRHKAMLGSTRVAGRYLPAAGALRIGGDWYEVMHGSGTITLVIGDVVGHGLAAAAVMGKLSSAARALATAVADPAALVRELERFAAGTPGGEMTTVVCADFTQATRVLRYCRAGHPPPIVRMPDGRVVLLDAPGGGPLCSGAGPRHNDEIELPPGAILVAYTDGLIDWHESTLEQRMAELVEVASGLDAADPEANLDTILERMSSTSPQTDDIAVLCLAVAHG